LAPIPARLRRVRAQSPPSQAPGAPAPHGWFVRYATHQATPSLRSPYGAGAPGASLGGLRGLRPPPAGRSRCGRCAPLLDAPCPFRVGSRCGRCAPLLDARRSMWPGGAPQNSPGRGRANTGLPFYRTRNTQSVLPARWCAAAL